jgi:hypothetical protein
MLRHTCEYLRNRLKKHWFILNVPLAEWPTYTLTACVSVCVCVCVRACVLQLH